MTIKTEIKDQVAYVILNRPDAHNALNSEMIDSITKEFNKLSKNKDIRVVVLAGEGKSFCAGADLKQMQSMLDFSFEDNLNDAKKLVEMYKAIFYCSKPVIGKVHGNVFGGGVGLVSVCDIAISVKSAVFCLSEVKLGLIPAIISPFVLQKMPVSYASRYFLTAEKFSGVEAKNIGLVSEVIDDLGSLNDRINYFTKIICENGPEAVSICKSHIIDITNCALDKVLEESANLIAKIRVSKEGQEGMKAFFEKRLPVWIKNKIEIA